MIDLKIVVEQYPQCLETHKLLAGLLHDLFPSDKDKRYVNLALNIYDGGIVDKISELTYLDSMHQHIFVKQLVEEYGLQEDLSLEGITMWAKAYGILSEEYKGGITHTPVSMDISDMPSALYAEEGKTVYGSVSDYDIEHYRDGIVITKFHGNYEKTVVVPNSIANKRVLGVKKNAFSCFRTKKIIVSDGIEFIDDAAFSLCARLDSILLPESLLQLGAEDDNGGSLSGVFTHSSIQKIALPKNIRCLGKRTFYGCKKLASVSLPKKLEKICEYSFFSCSDLNEIVFPDSVKEIGKDAFSSCSSLSRVVLNEGLKKICATAFYGCTSLKEFFISSTVTEIEDSVSGRDIFNSPDIRDTLVIYCYPGTFGYEYAVKKGYKVKDAKEFNK